MEINIKKRTVFNFLLLLPFMEPYLFQVEYPQIHKLYWILKFISCAIIFVIKVISIEEKNGWQIYPIKIKQPVFLSWSIFWAYLLINTIIQGEMTKNFFVNIFSVLFVMWWLSENENSMRDFINVLLLWAEILIYLNLACMFIFPQGMYVSLSTGNATNWLLGYDNFFEQTFIPAYILSLIYAYQNKKYLRTIALIIAMHISAFITKPGVLVVSLAFMDICLLFGIYKLKNLFNLGTNVAIIFLTMIGIFFFNIQTKFWSVIFDLLGKDATFTGRTIIWTYIWELIKEAPIFGYGFSDGYIRLSKMNYILNGAFNAHNQILEFLWEGGIVLLLIFIVCTMATIKKSRQMTGPIAQFLVLGITTIFITFIVKAYIQTTPIFIFLLWGLMDYNSVLSDKI